MMKLLSDDNRITFYIPIKDKWSVELPFCDVVFIRSANAITLWVKTLKTLLKDRKRLDVLIAYNPSVKTSPIIFLKILRSVPVVVDYVDKRGVSIGRTRNNLRSLVGSIYVRVNLDVIVERLFLLTINNWITSTKYLQNEIRRFKKDANILFYRGTFSEQLCLDEKTELFSVIVNENVINIAYMGALYPTIGVDILLNAFSKLAFENIHLYITGHGPMKPVLKNTVEEKKISNVSIIHLDYGVVHKFMSEMNILVLPLKNAKRNITNFPSKIIEYLWAGKAIIATTVGEDVLDIFENGKTAILIEPENEEALRIALADLITDEKKRKELGVNARRHFDDNFSEKIVKSKITEYLNDIVNSKRFGHRDFRDTHQYISEPPLS
ncbi:MAG: Glycosyl transferases group 1 [Candidatus Argoarchaeum ethanivorans]|uniref:Glycosyl transferases group 1 n=1 Tax=Candidatus Argoarchaeum ethanivorans TaxID=2608793 RepID=A0A811T6A2_9EURY|nr:MAG: Glycosyl transferases group 1 [Candidatus Argoarchaeum ethanivorans]